jgi:hypothetical protein
MTTLRFDFQRQCVRNAIADIEATPHWRNGRPGVMGVILNVGANEDPANLKAISPERILNCDLFDHDQVLDRPNHVDVLFDCACEKWPFYYRAAALVVFGDILEHLAPDEIRFALTEARTVARKLCITVPCDERESNCDDIADTMPRGAVHRTIVTEELLRHLLDETGWTVKEWQEVEYDSGVFWGKRTMGFFVACE